MRLVSQISTLLVYVLITCPVLLVRGEISVRTTPGTLDKTVLLPVQSAGSLRGSVA